MRRILGGTLCLLLVGVVVFPQTSAAKDGALVAALKVAIFHSGELAQQGTVLAAAQLHVQHVINCLEGPSGKDSKAAVGYPCQGAGIIPDLQAAVAAGTSGADTALRYATVAWTLALQALAQKDVNEVQPWAKVVSSYLRRALDAIQ